MDLLTVKQTAELYGYAERHVRRLIKAGDIYAQEHKNPDNGRKQYMIPVSSLPADVQKRYYKSIEKDLPLPIPPQKPEDRERRPCKAFSEYAAADRAQITMWTNILQQWQVFRGQYPKSKTKADPMFVAGFTTLNPGIQLSVDILYRKWAAYKSGDLDALLGKRGGYTKGQSSIPKAVWDAFLYYYLDDKQLPATQTYEITKDWLAEFFPEYLPNLPSLRTFRRRLETIPRAVMTYMRKGEKACYDESLPYIERLYDELEANDCWIADNHTLDIASKMDGTETVHRLHITAFIDAKSGVMVGWNITENPCSNSTIFALRMGIERFGAPRMVYFDNGTEFLTYDIAGRGHRSRKSTSMIEHPPAILQRLGIEMRNALVRNARAKPIERTFLTFKNSISRLFETYTGGNVLEKPESLKRKLKQGIIPMDSKLREDIAVLVDGLYNVGQYGGSERRYKGYTRLEVWHESIKNREIRRATADELDLMLMRNSRYQKIQRKGVYIEISGEKLWYADEKTWMHLGEEVYVRYDPTNLTAVRVYDKDDRYLYNLPADRELMLDFIEDDQGAISDAQAKMRRTKKAIKDHAKGLTAGLTAEQRIDALDIRCRKAHAAREGMLIAPDSPIVPIRANEQQAAAQVAGGDATVIDIDLQRMNRNAARRKNKGGY